MNKHWELLSKKEISKPEDLRNILLKNRGLTAKADIDAFLSPPAPSSYSLVQLGINKTQFDKSVARVKQAVKNDEQIIVYGDYDADGICATAILWEALDKIGAKAHPYIPNRFEDGYGINPNSLEKIVSKYRNLKLLITVDNGIVAFEAAKKAKALGVDLIITDHHEAKKEIPVAHSIIHTTATSGSALSWVFARAISGEENGLELAAIGTISDQMPLLSFNRSIVKHGLPMLEKTQRIGLRKLFATAGLLEKPIGTYEINFLVAPRINASGRMAEGMDALRLLCTRSPGRALKLAVQLNELNLERQKTVEEALVLADKNVSSKSSVVILAHEDFHEGIIGLIASRIVEKYSKPAIVMSVGESQAKASARSIDGFSMVDLIRAQEHLIIEGGGHDMAGGFSIDPAKISEFEASVETYAKPLLTNDVLDRKIKIDSLLQFSLINQEGYGVLEEFKPYGMANPSPVFATKGVEIVSQKLVGKDKNHLKMTFKKEGVFVNAIYFGQASSVDSKEVDIAYRMSENRWNGKTSIEVAVKDIQHD